MSPYAGPIPAGPLPRPPRSVPRTSSGALAIFLLSACVNPPPRAPVPQQALSANHTAASATAAPARPAAVNPARSDVDSAMRQRGYKPATFRGERVYCRNEAVTGSNLQSRVCRTAKQIEDQEGAGRDVLDANRPAGCLPKSGCN